MIKELTNGDYYLYQIDDGGCGIVKASNEAEAIAKIMDAYRGHGGAEYDALDIVCKNICDVGNVFFADHPSVIEIGWRIEF